VIEKIKHINHISHFRLSMFLPMAALLGFVKRERLEIADSISPSKDIKTGSYNFLGKSVENPDSFRNMLKNISHQYGLEERPDGSICDHFGFRESIGENIACEGNRGHPAYDTFRFGQRLFHLVRRGGPLCLEIKKFDGNKWEPAEHTNMWEYLETAKQMRQKK